MRKTAGAVRQNARHIAILSIIGAFLVVATAATADTRAPVRIMPCGDSITYDNHSGDTRPDSLRTGYRQPLWLLLEGAGYDVDFVGKVRAGYGAVPHFDSDSEGHPGWQDHQVADSIYVWLEQNPADIILLHIGTNGLNTDESDVEDILDEVDRYESDYSTDVTVLLARIINRMNHVCPNSSTTTAFNDSVAAMAQRRIDNASDRIVLVDMECGAGIDYREQPTGDMYDNLHPTDGGYAKMADLWFAHLVQILTPAGCPAGMTHYWRLEEAVGPPYADSYGDDPASCTDCPTSVPGIVGDALAFDGADDEVAVPNDGSWDWAADEGFTIEFWMWKDTTCDGLHTDFNEVIVGRDDPGTNLHWWVGVGCGSEPQGRPVFQLRDTSGAGDAIWGTTLLTDGEWHHVAAVRDAAADSNRLYVDGHQEASMYFDYSNGFGGATELEIGFMELSDNYRYEGIVDEVATYDRGLEPAEILAHYQNGLSGVGYCSASPSDPVITSSPVVEAVVGRAYTYDVEATGFPAPTFSLGVHPDGMDIDPVTGLVTWTPTALQLGGNAVQVIATNTARGADTQSFTVAVSEAPTCPDGMVHYWAFDDGTGSTAADFLADLDGTLQSHPAGSQPSWAAGTVGGALDFNGSSEFVTVPDDATLDWGADQSFSIELWCSFTNVASRNKVMIGRDNRPGGEHWWLGAQQNTGYAYLNLLNDDNEGDNIIGTTAMNDGAWHHLVALRDAATDTCKVYLDGGLEGAFHFDYGNGFQAPTTLGIGYMAYTGTPDYYYDGLLDEIALYDRALTLTEIKEHHANGLAGQGYCTIDEAPPVITSTPPTDAAVGVLYTYDVNASGHPAPTFSLSTAPAGMDVDVATGLITWVPTAGQEGPNDVTVVATNTAPDKAIDTQSYTIDVSAAAPCPPEMTAYWRLDETSGSTYEDSYGDHDASASSAPVPVTGTVGGAQAFDGSSDFIAVPAHADFDWGANDSFTIEYWMRKDSSCGGSDIPSNEVIVGRDDTSGATDIHWWTGVWCSGTPQGAAVFQLRDENRNGEHVAGTTVVTDGDWHHVVCVRDGGADSNRIFVDGDFEGGIYWDYTAGFSSASGEPIEIGRQHNGFYYDGEADEVAIYARALTPGEIETHYQAGLSGQGYCEMVPTPPMIVSAPDTTATAGFLYTYDVDATGYPAPTYALTVSPDGMGIDDQTGLITWTPTGMQVGDHDVTVEATNTARAMDSQSFVVHVTEGLGEMAIMPLGDSITDGAAGSSDDTGYRRSLYLQLESAGYEVNFVGSDSSGIPGDFDGDHEGHGGWRADQIRDNVRGWLEVNPADIVLLHIGTNDVSGGNEDVGEVEAILDSIDVFENSVRRDVTVFVARIILRNDSKNPETIALNEAVETMVETRIGAGDRLVMVDMESALTYPDHLADSVHPNDAGYQVMADTWFGALDSFLSGVAVSNLVLDSTSGADLDSDDLIASFDLVGDATTAATAWSKGRSSLMVAYLPMEGGATNALDDYSGSGNHGSPVGDPTWDASAGFDGNGCFVFDGNGDYIDLGECMPTGAYTKAAWLYYEPGNSWNNIISGYENHAFWVADYSGFRLAGGHDGNWDQVTDPTVFPVGSWQFCALSYDPGVSGGKLMLYRNGAVVDSAAGIAGITSDTRAFIGTYQDECCEVKGRIDDARIYGHALSRRQIAALYDSGDYDPNTIVAEETSVGETWQALVTPFSETEAGVLQFSNTVTIQSDAPTPPVIVSVPVTDATVGRLYSYDVEANGVPAPTYSLSTAPSGMGIDGVTGLITWTPGAADVGPNDVTVVATNTARATDTQSFTIEVAPAPACPEAMVHYWRLEETAGPPYEDSYGDTDMTCSSCPSPTTGIVGDAQEFDGATDEVQIPDDGTFDWDADDSFTIEYWMLADDPVMAQNRVIVGRDGGATSLHWWIGYDSSNGKARFQLQDVNAHGRYIGAIGPVVNDGVWHHMAAVRNDTLGINIIYVDGAVVDTAYYNYTADFAEDVPVQVGYIELSSHHYRYPGTLDELASYDRALSGDEIEDHYLAGLAGHGYCVTEETIPVITTPPVTDAVVEAPYSYDVDATGHPQPVFALTTGPAAMTLDDVTGLLEWTPAAGDTGAHDVEVVASNSAGADTQAFVVTVTPAPEIPVITSVPVTAAIVGAPYAYDVDATGYPEPALALQTGPAAMTIDAAGLLEWTPAAGDTGAHNVEVVATNTAGADTQAFVLAVGPAPSIPVITSTPGTDALVGVPYSYDVDATGHPAPTYALGLGPAAMTVDEPSGLLEWTPAAADTGAHDIEVWATNASGVDTQAFTLSVTPAPEAPVITSVPVTAATVDQAYAYDVDATGFPEPTFALGLAPAAMTIDEPSGLIEWTPAADDTGAHDVEVWATNASGVDTQAFSVDVESRQENVVAAPDTLFLRLGEGEEVVSIDYLGGGDGLLYSYSVVVTWDGTLAATVDSLVVEGDLLSGAAPTFFSARSTGVDEVTVDCAILGGHDGVTGPGTMCAIPFTAVSPGVSPFDITIVKVRDRFNHDLTGFAEEDGTIVVLDAPVVVTDATIENAALPHTDDYVKNGDAVHVTATVTQGAPLGRSVEIEADLTGLGGPAAAPPDSYDGNTAVWDLAAATCVPADGIIQVTVTATNASNEQASNFDTIIADNTPPTAVSDFDAAPGHERCALSWTNGDDDNLAGVMVRRTGVLGEYPTYDTFVAEWSVDEAAALYPAGPTDGELVYAGAPIDAYVDTVSPRGICFYQAFCYDSALNPGPASASARDAATDYWLGDLADGGSSRGYDGYINFEDLMIFAIHYGSVDPVGQGLECDFGPTVHPVQGSFGLPTPDGTVEFEDLMIFAMNYGETSPAARTVPILSEEGVGGAPALALERRGVTAAGEVEIALRLEGNTGEVKGLSAVVGYAPSELKLVAVHRAAELESPLAYVFFWCGDLEDAVRIDAAVLGAGLTIGGSGDIAMMTFRPIADEFTVGVADGHLRDVANTAIDADLGTYDSLSGPPLAFRLLQNVPNPFNPVTTVGYHVPRAAAVRIEIYDVAGRLVRTLVDAETAPGRHSATWDGRNDKGIQIGSGIYFCRMEAEAFSDTRKMLLLK